MDSDLIKELCLSFGSVFIGSFFLFRTWKNYKLARKTKNWPQTTGTILKSEIVSFQSGSGKNRYTTYRPKIHYHYTVDGQEHHSSQIFIGNMGDAGLEVSQIDADEYVSKYPVGKQVMVYYSPSIYQSSDKEKCSVLETGVNDNLHDLEFLSGLFVVGGCAFLLIKHPEYGILTTIVIVALALWVGRKTSSSRRYVQTNNQVFSKIPRRKI